VAEDERGLLVVDQHVAHERILYEELSRQAADGPLARQLLLFPEPVDLGAADGEFVRAQAELLGRLGFGFEPFGTGTVLVREVPAVYGRRGRATALAELVGTLRERGEAEAQDLFSRVIATVACHSAVRKGMALGPGQMSYLLRGLACCEVPSHCPHGRVISIRVDLGALDRTFDRA
jgi:DNA mismatch repair protein MutL